MTDEREDFGHCSRPRLETLEIAPGPIAPCSRHRRSPRSFPGTLVRRTQSSRRAIAPAVPREHEEQGPRGFRPFAPPPQQYRPSPAPQRSLISQCRQLSDERSSGDTTSRLLTTLFPPSISPCRPFNTRRLIRHPRLRPRCATQALWSSHRNLDAPLRLDDK